MAPRQSHRDFIVRIGRSVRLARAAESVLATAIWDRLPIYGQAERTVEGALALACPLARASDSDPGGQPGEADLLFCRQTQRIVFPGLAALGAPDMAAWAKFIEPYSVNALAAVPHGARISMLHADS